MTFSSARSTAPSVVLNDGNVIPKLGLGVWQVPPEDTYAAVTAALQAGYRSVDTAAAYGNEVEVGRAVREFGLPRNEVFVTTKLWNSDQGYDSALRAFDASMRRLGLEYLDLYLIHWPVARADRFVDTFRAFVSLKAQGRVGSIGVSNFTGTHLERLIAETGEVPALNQIELHPGLAQAQLRAFHAARGIATEAWSPLGQGTELRTPTVVDIAAECGRSPAQVIIRWHLQLGTVVIPKSLRPDRIRENFDVFSFELTTDQMQRMNGLDRAQRVGPDPDRFALDLEG